MMTSSSSQRPPFDSKGSQFGAPPRHSNGSQAPSLQSQQQAHPPTSRNTSSQSHQAHGNGGNPGQLNTEIRAQARKEREATRERSKEKLSQQQQQQQHLQTMTSTASASVSLHGAAYGRERSSSVMSSYQGSERKISPNEMSKTSIGGGGQQGRPTLSRHGRKVSTGAITNENNPPLSSSASSSQQLFGSRPPLQPIHSSSFQERQERFIMEDSKQHFGNLASRIPSPPKGDETKSEFDSMQTAYFVKYYYDMVEKCHSWQRYASNMKARAETLDIENQILKDINEKQDQDIRALELEVATLKQATMTQDHSLPSSYSVPLLPSQVWERPISPERVAKRQVSAGGEAGLLFLNGSINENNNSNNNYKRDIKGQDTIESESEGEHQDNHHFYPNHDINQLESGFAALLTVRGGSTGGGSVVEGLGMTEGDDGSNVMRGGSAHSDAMTVTEDYLQDIVEQKRRLRKVSLNQQQQLHYLQARIHLNSSASQNSLTSEGVGGSSRPSSRPSSRMSNHGVRSKVRSRAGSYTVHDSIPVAKDDVFSSQGSDLMALAPTKRSGSMPLSAIQLNHQSSQSDVSECHSGDGSSFSIAAKREGDSSTSSMSLQQQQQHDNSSHEAIDQSGNLAATDNDPKGAHRRLYIRLRDELETADLVRFERYVHRYDALEIGIDGSRGIINRVRRLLLPDELVRSKLTLPEKYRCRKELAREFERIVREDAFPKDGEHSQEIKDFHSEAVL